MSPAIGIDIDVRWITVEADGEPPDSGRALLRWKRENLELTHAQAAAALGGMDELAYAAIEAGRRRFADDASWGAALVQLEEAARKS